MYNIDKKSKKGGRLKSNIEELTCKNLWIDYIEIGNKIEILRSE